MPDHPLEKGLSAADRRVLEEMSQQPEGLQVALLEVAKRGDLLVRIPALWADFDVGIEPLLADYGEDERAALLHLVRHPGLLEALVGDVPHGEPELREIVQAWPPEIREFAVVAGRDHRDLLAAIAARTQTAVAAFETLIRTAAPETRSAFRSVVAQPALTELLVDHLAVSEYLGGASRLDPEGTRRQLADLGRAVSRARQEAEARAERQRAAEARAAAERAEAERRRDAERRAWRLYHGRYPYWGARGCWYDDPFYDPWWPRSHNRCWYPWYGYGSRWW